MSSTRTRTRPPRNLSLTDNSITSKMFPTSDTESPDSAASSNASSELFERQTRSGMGPAAGGSITDDSSPEDDDETKTLKKLHRKAKRKLSTLSERFERAKNAYIDSALSEVESEQKSIKAGSHPLYLDVLKQLEDQKSTKISSAQGQRRLHCEEIERLYDADVKIAFDQFRQRKAALRTKMISEISNKIRQLDKERSILNTKALDVPLLTRLPPRLPPRTPRTLTTTTLNTLSRREMDDDLLKIGLSMSRPRKKKRHHHTHRHRHRQVEEELGSSSELESPELPSPPITPHTPKSAMSAVAASSYSSTVPQLHPTPTRASVSSSPMPKAALLYKAMNNTPTRRHITMEDVLG